MQRFQRLAGISPIITKNFFKGEEKFVPIIPLQNAFQWTSSRFLDIYQMGSKKAIEKERARIQDEMNRGYFADMSEMKKHGGKIGMANKIIIPAATAFKFPTIEVNCSDGSMCKLPVTLDGNDADKSKSSIPKASLICLSFRASSQPMVDTWSLPFLNAFGNSGDVRLYEVSFIDSWVLCRSPIKKLLLKVMRKPKPEEKQQVLQRQITYYFGDHYYFRKELKILNLLTGYIFLLDKFGRIRWQGFGTATQDELSSLVFCTSRLLEEE